MHALKHKCGTNESDIKLMLRSGSPPSLFSCHNNLWSWSNNKIRIALKVFTSCTLCIPLLFFTVIKASSVCFGIEHRYISCLATSHIALCSQNLFGFFCFENREVVLGWNFWKRDDYVFLDNVCLLLVGCNSGCATLGFQNFKELHLCFKMCGKSPPFSSRKYIFQLFAYWQKTNERKKILSACACVWVICVRTNVCIN